jgi:sigma-E factor negative regulatory protein RseA
MTKIHESFSAFLDGEASELDVQRMLKAYEEDPSIAQHWHDLSSAQALMNDEFVSQAGQQLGNLDHAAVQTENRLSRWFPRSAVAAIVAVSITSGFWLIAEPEPASSVPQISIDQSTQPNSVIAAQQFEAQQRLQAFLKEHVEQASFTTGHGVIPSDIEWSQVSDVDE